MNLLGMKRKLLPLGSPQGGKGGGGGGSAPPPSSQTVTNTSIPEYARPYVETMLGQSSALTDINQNPYQNYGGQRIAEFNKTQQDAFNAAINQTPSSQLGSATDLATQAGYGGLNMAGQSAGLQNQALGYGQAGSMYGGLGAQQAMQSAQRAQQQAQMYGRQGAGYGAQAAGLAPQAQQFGQQAADIGLGGLGYGALGAGYGGRGAQAAEQGFGAGAQFAQQATDPAATRAYMSPYMQNAVDYQKSEAIRDFNIGQQAQRARAVGSGAFGGSRQAIVESEAQRNLSNQLGGIQATGTQKAFEDAQRQQQFGAQLGLQGLQAGYGGLGLGMQGAGVGLSGLGTALQGQQAGLQGLGQAGSLFGQGMQGAQTGLSGVGQQLGAGQLGLQGTSQGMQGAQSGLQGVQGAIGAGQYGLQGLGTAGTAASQLGQLGQTQFGQEQAISAEQQKIGAIQQAQAQQAQDLAYQDFLKQKNYPYQQLAFMSDMLRGLPLSQSAQSQYTAPPNMGSQLGGLGMSALGIYGASGGFRAKGGMVGKGYAEGGLMAAKAYKDGGYADGGDIAMMNVKQLTEMLDNPTLTPLEVEMVQKRIMLLSRMANNPAAAEIMGQGIDSIPTGDMVPEQMAGGGIVAFKDGGKSDEDYRTFLESQVRKSIENQMSGDAFSRSAADKAKVEKGLKDREENRIYELMANIGAGTAAGTSQYGLSNLGAGLNQGVKTYGQTLDKDAANQLKLLEAQLYADKAEDARRSSLTGQMTTSLGQLYGRDATLAAARANAGDPQGKLLARAQALFNNDPTVKGLEKRLEKSGAEPGSPEYQYYEDKIAERNAQIFKFVGLDLPPVQESKIKPPPAPVKEPGFFSGLFGGSKAPASQNKIVPFNQLPS
jgi:hypothetical protein